MSKLRNLALGVAALAALALGGAVIAQAGDEQGPPAVSQESAHQDAAEDEQEGPDQAITGSALDQASAAALDYLGGGKVTETEVGDEESKYEVEVTNEDGTQTDVQLDAGFNVVGEETDGNEDD